MEKERENTIQSIISIYNEMGAQPELAVQKLMDQCKLSKEQAEEQIALYGAFTNNRPPMI